MNNKLVVNLGDGYISISNYSTYEVWVFEKPIPPKRKHKLVLVVKPNHTCFCEFSLEINNLSFEWRSFNENTNNDD